MQCENNADYTLMFWLLLSSAYPKSRTSFFCCCLFHAVPLKRHTNKSWEGALLRQVTQSGQMDIPCHRISCPVYKVVELPGRGFSWSVGVESGIAQQVMSSCIVHHLFFLEFYFSLLILLFIICHFCFNC